MEDTVISLNKLYPLIVCDSNGYFTFHNDVRLFFKETMVSNSNYDILALEVYHKYFSSTDWIMLFDNIVSSISTSNMDDFYCINEDIEIL